MSFKKMHKRVDVTLRRRQGPGGGSPLPTVSTSSTTTRPLPAAALTSTQTHAITTSTNSLSTTSSTSVSSVSSTISSVVSTPAAQPTSSVAPVNTLTRSSVASSSSHSTIRSTTTRSATTATTTSNETEGMSVGSIAGIAAAAIIGIAVMSAFVIWLIRRKKKNHDIDEEPFNRNSYMRNSTVIPDDDVGIPSRTRPQPNMAERQPTYGGAPSFNDPGYNSFGYNTQPSYGAPQPGYNPNPFGPGGAPATPLPHSPGYGNTYDQGYNQGGYTELTRGGPHDYPPSPHTFDQFPPSPSYAGHDKFPAPPPSANNYPELSPAPASSQGHVVVTNNNVHDGRETPVQLGFAPAQPRQPNGAPAPGPHGKGQPRPDTIYDHEDAYGGM